MKNAIVIDQNNYKCEFVLVEATQFDGETKEIPVSYVLKDGEQLIYKDVEIALSMIKPRWNGEEWIETGVREYTPEDIENKRKEKLNEVNIACQNSIFAGIDLETSEGEKHFSLTQEDQINITALTAQLEKALAGDPMSTIDLVKGVPCHADGELCRFWPTEEFAKITMAATSHVFYHQTYCNHLRQYIKNMGGYEELSAAYYGMDLPDDLQASMEVLLGGGMSA